MSPKPTSDAKTVKKNIPIRTYGRRRAKGLRPARADAMDEMMPVFSIPAGEGIIDPRSFFPKMVKEVWLEIGFGNGEHLLQQAIDNPKTGFIGCEPFVNGVSALCVGIRENN